MKTLQVSIIKTIFLTPRKVKIWLAAVVGAKARWMMAQAVSTHKRSKRGARSPRCLVVGATPIQAVRTTADRSSEASAVSTPSMTERVLPRAPAGSAHSMSQAGSAATLSNTEKWGSRVSSPPKLRKIFWFLFITALVSTTQH